MIPKVNGIFGHMTYDFRAELSKPTLDLMFFSNYGLRNPSPIVETVQGTYGQQLTNEELTQLAGVILSMYKTKWDKLGKVYDIEYDPIHNYLDAWSDRSNEQFEGEKGINGETTVEYGKTIDREGRRIDDFSSHTTTSEDNTREQTDDLVKTENRELLVNQVRTDDLHDTMNYGREEVRTDDLSESMNYGRNSTRTDNLIENVDEHSSGQGSDNTSNAVYAFNSTAPQDTDVSGESNSSTNELARATSNTGTQTDALSGIDQKINSGSTTNSTSGADTRDNTGSRTTVTEDGGKITTSDEGTVTTVDDKNGVSDVQSTNDRGTTENETTGGSDVTTVGNTVNEKNSEEVNRMGNHFGNIGNLTSQKQILEEINLWKWNYMQEILNDVKEFCTLPVYLRATAISVEYD